MNNVIGTAGIVPKDRPIRIMTKGEVGYTVPWAYNHVRGELNEEFIIGKKGGTCSLRVECVRDGVYSLTFESPVYRVVGNPW